MDFRFVRLLTNTNKDMKILNAEKSISISFRFLLVLGLLLIPGISMNANFENETVKINKNIKIKRSSGDTVSLIAYSNFGEKEEFVFTDFNADVVLLLYRRVELNMIIKNLSKKYFLTKTDTRRYMKMTINTLEQWNLISRI